MMIAEVGSRLNEKGRRMAIVATGPIPGSTPINVPMITPTKQARRFTGVKAMLETMKKIT